VLATANTSQADSYVEHPDLEADGDADEYGYGKSQVPTAESVDNRSKIIGAYRY